MTFTAPPIDLPNACLYTTFERAARMSPDKVALELLGVNRVTFAQLMTRADALAAMLLTQGVRPGDRVAFMAKNRTEIMDVFLGCSRIGQNSIDLAEDKRAFIPRVLKTQRKWFCWLLHGLST